MKFANYPEHFPSGRWVFILGERQVFMLLIQFQNRTADFRFERLILKLGNGFWSRPSNF
jgi:hypothetical protein